MKTLYPYLIGCSFLIASASIAQPCDNVQPILCDSVISFTVNGVGDPDYPVGMNGQGCAGNGSGQGGQERVFSFTAPEDGTYQINLLTAPGYPYEVGYYFKDAALGCDNLNWTCFSVPYDPGPLYAWNLQAGQSILLLLNARSAATHTQTFKIKCATRVCDNIIPILCDSVNTFAVSGFGDPDYPVGMNGQGCAGNGSGQGGQERVFSFTAPEDGTYQINLLTAPGYPYEVGYYFKDAALGCDNLNWTCFSVPYDPGPLYAWNLQAGQSILLLLNARSAATHTQTFKIKCATRVCDNIIPILCDSVNTFAVSGFGDPDYPVGMNGQGCAGNGSGQGGQERVFSFTAPEDGTYQINLLTAPGYPYEVGYYFKDAALGCDNLNWTCFSVPYDPGPLYAWNLQAGQSILLLLNARSAATHTQTFKIKCATRVCDNIIPILCDSVNTFAVSGFGDPDYPMGMNGQGCAGNGSGQGGQERVFSFTAPEDGTYQINLITAPGYPYEVGYYFKDAALGCDNLNWTCFSTPYDPGPLYAWNLQAGQSILLLLNARSAATHTQTFKIKCATRVCDNIIPILCDSVNTFAVSGFGDPDYPMGMNGQGCAGNGSGQGGQERVFSFTAPEDGTYQINLITAPGYPYEVGYYFKDAALGCDNLNWTCFSVPYDPGPLYAWNLQAGQSIMLLLNARSGATHTQTFKIKCAQRVCDDITEISYEDTTRFNVSGYGNPDYPNGMNGQGCSSGTAQGGLERAYRFIAPEAGDYKMGCFAGNGNYLDYYYKLGSESCSDTGWSCIARIPNANALLHTFSLQEGDTVLFLLNAENPNTTDQRFKFCLGEPPVASFNYVLDINQASFNNTSVNSLSTTWIFGDGTTYQGTNAQHVFEEVGIYNVCATEHNQCGNTTSCQILTVRGMESIFPNEVADIGVYTFAVRGLGFDLLDEFKLTRAGESDLLPDSVTYVDSSYIKAHYTFINVPNGTWTPTATLSNSDVLTLMDGLLISEAEEPELEVSITGSHVLRIGVFQVYTVTVSNSSNTDAYYPHVFISGLPDSTMFTYYADRVVQASELPTFSGLTIDWDTVNTAYLIDPQTSRSFDSFILYKVPAGGQVSVGVSFDVPNTTPVHTYEQVRASVSPPVFSSTDLAIDGAAQAKECEGLVAGLVLEAFLELTSVGEWTECLANIALLGKSTIDDIDGVVSSDNTLEATSSVIIGTAPVVTGLFETTIECAEAAGSLLVPLRVGLIMNKYRKVFNGLEGIDMASTAYSFDANCLDSLLGNLITDWLSVIMGNAWDPNIKVGPGGGSVGHYMNDFEDWNYNIYFENDSTAGLPAQTIVLVDTLDTTKFDLSTFRFTSVTIGEHVASLPDPHLSFLKNINLVNDYGVIARVTGQLDTTSGVVTWIMRTIDPGTGQVTTDPAAGFLPPDTVPPTGQGNVGFSVRLRPEVTHLDSVSNTATIIFDYNPPMGTPEWTCVLDTIKPQSTVADLPPTMTASEFMVEWAGTDDFSGVQSYIVRLSVDGGTWQNWLSSSDTTAALFVAEPGHSYGFYSLAVDSAGNVEDPPSIDDAVTEVPVGIADDLSFSSGLRVFPNPTTGTFSLEFNDAGSAVNATITNTLGQPILTLPLNGNQRQTIDLSPFENGVYFLEVRYADGSSVVERLIKQ